MDLEYHPNQPSDHSPQSESARLGFQRVREPDLNPPEPALDLDAVIAFVTEQYYIPGIEAYFEGELRAAGLMARLEQVGVLPGVENPEPDYHPDSQAFDQWWAEHPVKADEIVRQIAKRQEVVRCLFVGAALGHLVGDLLFPRLEKPSDLPAQVYLGSVFPKSTPC